MAYTKQKSVTAIATNARVLINSKTKFVLSFIFPDVFFASLDILTFLG